MARSPNPTITSTPPFACTSHMMYRAHVQECIPTKNLQHPQNTQAPVSFGAKLAVSARLHLRMARSPHPTIISASPFACTSHMMSTTHVQEGIPTKNLQHPQNTQAPVSFGAKLAVSARLHLRMARSPHPTIISASPFACTSHMMSTTHVQEGIPTKNLQHPQNTKDQVSFGAKLSVSAPFTP